MLGVDLSDYQAAISFDSLKDKGIKFCFAKATEGRTFTATSYARHRHEAARVGIVFGAYHYARPNTDIPANPSNEEIERDAAAEADHFLAVAAPKKNDLKPVLDFEERSSLGAGEMKRWARRFLDVVEEACGEPPILYTFPSFWREEMGNDGAVVWKRYLLWLASYGPNDGQQHALGTVVPLGAWDKPPIHQYTSKGTVPGWHGTTLDLNETRLLLPNGAHTPEIDLGTLRLGRQPSAAGVPYGAPWTILAGPHRVKFKRWGVRARRYHKRMRTRYADVRGAGTPKRI